MTDDSSNAPASDASDLSELRTLALFISFEVTAALQAAIVMHAAKAPFYADKLKFRGHPGNTFQFRALKAMEDRALVTISEFVSVAPPIMGLDKELVAEWVALKGHRHYVSHPATVDWDRAWMRDFVKERRQFTDVRPALIWQAQEAMNARLIAAGLEPHVTGIEVTWAMTGMLHDIFTFSMEAEPLQALGSRGQLHEQLVPYGEKFMEQVTKRRSLVKAKPAPDDGATG